MRISAEEMKKRDHFVRSLFKKNSKISEELVNKRVCQEFGVGMARERIHRLHLKKSPVPAKKVSTSKPTKQVAKRIKAYYRAAKPRIPQQYVDLIRQTVRAELLAAFKECLKQ